MKIEIQKYALLVLLLVSAACSKEDELIELKIVKQDYVLRSQADIAQFLAEHADARRIALDGSLTIGLPLDEGESSDITSLEDLSQLKEVRQDFILSMNHNLHSLQGLEGLERVRGTFRILRNGLQGSPELPSLLLADSLIISLNNDITSLAAFDKLRVVGSLLITENEQLQSLQGLEELDSLNNLQLVQNRHLTDLSGLQNLQKIRGLLDIRENVALQTLEGLNNLQQADSIRITDNPSLLELCPLYPAVSKLRTDRPEATEAEMTALINLQDNGRPSYGWQQLLAECAE